MALQPSDGGPKPIGRLSSGPLTLVWTFRQLSDVCAKQPSCQAKQHLSLLGALAGGAGTMDTQRRPGLYLHGQSHV